MEREIGDAVGVGVDFYGILQPFHRVQFWGGRQVEKGEFRLEWENLIINSSFWGGTADCPSCSGRQKKENWHTVEKR